MSSKKHRENAYQVIIQTLSKVNKHKIYATRKQINSISTGNQKNQINLIENHKHNQSKYSKIQRTLKLESLGEVEEEVECVKSKQSGKGHLSLARDSQMQSDPHSSLQNLEQQPNAHRSRTFSHKTTKKKSLSIFMLKSETEIPPLRSKNRT